ncbi:MAG: N-acetylmuramic acid 6-phosphate etherase [Phycisphaeraceae bacterium]|nr:N-acetylmuramic acid 6-phosphate etherase [Phycisphaeraceae bacterium]
MAFSLRNSAIEKQPAQPVFPPERGHLLTEQPLAAAAELDALPIEGVMRVINDQDATIAGVVRGAIPALAKLVEDAVKRVRRGGRLIYLGAGTSGRLGVLDASECPPTFFVDPGVVVGIIAGGDAALRKSSEGKEDDPAGAEGEFERLRLAADDLVLGIAAGGTTPYVLGGLKMARQRGAGTGLLTCVNAAELGSISADHVITLPVGPEVVAGSTRMKAGTATKLALNMISTTLMVQLGKTWGQLMVDLRATNAKLRDRAARILMGQTNLARAAALELLDRADGRVKLALVMALKQVEAKEAQRLLDEQEGKLRGVVGRPKQ